MHGQWYGLRGLHAHWEAGRYIHFVYGTPERTCGWEDLDVFVDPAEIEALIARNKEQNRQYEELLTRVQGGGVG